MRRRLGDFGENVATAHLKRQGYTILARNWRCQLGEIDLIAQAQGDLVFVEVRTRRSRTHGSPEESITKTKQQRLIALAYAYLEAHQLDNDATLAWRIDVVAIDIDHTGRIIRLNHIPYAIEAG
jgi:putative endonuclease